jgi:hypothetical protein
MNEDKKEEKITLRVDLRGPIVEKFRTVKEHFGLENDTELIRLLISEEYTRLSKIRASNS